MDARPGETTITNPSRPWWRLHGKTWAAVSLVVVASVYLNFNVDDLLYRVKYGPVRPSTLVNGWPLDAVEEDVVSAELHVNWNSILANIALTLIPAVGTAVQIEAWNRDSDLAWRFSAEHLLTVAVLLIVVFVLDVVNRSHSVVDLVDYSRALRWPAASILFIAMYLTCRSFIDCLCLVAARVTGRQRT